MIDLKKESDSKVLWGGPLWRRVLLFVLMVALIGAWSLYGPGADAAEPTTPPVKVEQEVKPRAPTCSVDTAPCRHARQSPAKMRANFKAGRYGNAAGARLPAWVNTQARMYYHRHPNQVPRSHQRTVAGKGIDWSFLDWTKDKLTTVRCVGHFWHPVGWVGCNARPNWEKTARRVTMRCGGTVAIIGVVTRSPVSAGSGGAVCLWHQVAP